MWHYFGSKARIAKLYPLPKHNLIIEPFAGAAAYSVLHGRSRKVLLNEKYVVVYKIWDWLINEATVKTILGNKDFYLGQNIMGLNLAAAHIELLRFCAHRGSGQTTRISKWCCGKKTNYATATAYTLTKIARSLHKIKHWKVQLGDYKDLPNVEATWFVDPPYQQGGENYKESNREIDYSELAVWCKTRKGQVIVCENGSASWLPFSPLHKHKGMNQKTKIECVWVNDEKRGGLREFLGCV